MEVIKVVDISKKSSLIKMKNFLTLNTIEVSGDAIQASSTGAVSEELLEKIEKVTQAIELEKVLCRPVPPVVVGEGSTHTEEVTVVAETPKKSKKHKRDASTASATKEKKKKKLRVE